MRDYAGSVFGRLTVVRSYRDTKGIQRAACYCSCGNIKSPQVSALLSGACRSCGCLKRELASIRAKKSFTKHGHYRTGQEDQIYAVWKTMIQRCVDPKHARYKSYGARGIRVCERWLSSFDNFVADMGPRPEGKNGRVSRYSIERNNSDGDYEPGNCRWATRKEQAANQAFPNRLKTACPRGHEYDPNGKRGRCRICENASRRERRRSMTMEERRIERQRWE
jgi:hypothetical protein